MKKEKLIRVDSLAYLLFIAGAGYLYGKNQVRLLGIVFGYIYFLANILKLNKILGYIEDMPIEIKLYFFWVVWSVLTGNFVSDNHRYFTMAAKQIIQMSFVVLFSYLIMIDKREPSLAFWGVLLGAFFQIAWIMVTYKNPFSILFIKERIAAHKLNPNGLGFLMLWSTGAILFIIDRRIKSLKYAMLIWGIIGYFLVVILATGSRKSFLGMILFLFIWFSWISPEIFKNRLLRRTISCLLVFIFVVLSYTSLPFILNRTTVGQRLLSLLHQNPESVIHTEHRLDMYIEGFKLFLDHPIFGVGLDNFRVYYWQRMYSHSDYMESLADTGLIGFLLYESFYFILLWKLRNLLKAIPLRNNIERYRVKLLITIILSILFIGFGTPHYNSISVFVILTAISVYIMLKKQDFLAINAR